jgi:hypothetical protein
MHHQLGDTTMLKRGKTALIVAITLGVLGATSAAMAGAKDDDNGGGVGGFVIPGSTVGVNPVYHPDLFDNSTAAFAQAQTSQTKQKDAKQAKKGSAPATKETEEEARKRRYEDNR